MLKVIVCIFATNIFAGLVYLDPILNLTLLHLENELWPNLKRLLTEILDLQSLTFLQYLVGSRFRTEEKKFIGPGPRHINSNWYWFNLQFCS